jgi:co-chaperonin GroES (HSP10)
MTRLLGNTVLLQPVAELPSSTGGILLPNVYRKPTLKFRVIAIGPGAWKTFPSKKKAFLKPEVKPGDIVISRCKLDHEAVKYAFEEGSECVIVHAESILAVQES